jgi:hypothetical protein
MSDRPNSTGDRLDPAARAEPGGGADPVGDRPDSVGGHTYHLPEGLPAPAPSPDGLGAEFFAAARRHELVVQRCPSCGTWQWGPEYVCHHCLSFNLAYERVEPRGSIYSFERCWHPVHPALNEAVPYLVVLVELPQAGGVRMVGNLQGDPLQDVEIGAQVEAVFEDHEEADPPFTLVHWRVPSKGTVWPG